jgi:hypothetical protein
MTIEAKAGQIKRLFSAWPQAADALSREAMGLYVEAASIFDLEDLAEAVSAFVLGNVAEHDKRFPPKVPEFADHCRRVRNARLDREARNRLRIGPPGKVSDLTAEDRKTIVARLRGTEGTLLKRIPAELYVTPAEHEAAKRRAIKEAEAAHTADLIIRASNGDEAALAEWRAQNRALGIAAQPERTAA